MTDQPVSPDEAVFAEPTAGGPAGQTLPTAPVPTQSEQVIRGILLALVVIPVGVVVWVLLWRIGFIASIVSFGVAWGALKLYRIGSGTKVSRGAFWALIGIIVVTIALSFLAAIASDLITVTGLTFGQAMTSDRFWSAYWNNVFDNPKLWATYAPQLLFAVAFAALGCYRTVIRMAREARS